MEKYERASEKVYAATEQDRFNKEVKYTAQRYGKNYSELLKYLEGVAVKRGLDAADRLKKGVDWYLKKQLELRKQRRADHATDLTDQQAQNN